MALRKAGVQVDPMEEWTAAAEEPKEFSVRRIKGCDLCVLLVARRRGFVPPGESRSITQMEYDYALAQGITLLVFLLQDEALWHRQFDELDTDPEICRWREALCLRHGIGFFDHRPDSIDIASALSRWSTELNLPTPQNSPFAVTWYTFAPFCPGIPPPSDESVLEFQAQDRDETSTTFVAGIPDAKLLWYNYSGAVWVVCRRLEFCSIAELAVERERHYFDILQGNHPIRSSTARLQEHLRATAPSAGLIQADIGYALSLISVERPGWSEAHIERAVQLLSCPYLILGVTPLQDIGQREHQELDPALSQREAHFLVHGIVQHDIIPFLLPGVVYGAASWAGVAFHAAPPHRAALDLEFARYEARLQALWWYIHQQTVFLDEGRCFVTPETNRQVRRQARGVMTVGPTETTALRLFKESVIATCRIDQVWKEYERVLEGTR